MLAPIERIRLAQSLLAQREPTEHTIALARRALEGDDIATLAASEIAADWWGDEDSLDKP